MRNIPLLSLLLVVLLATSCSSNRIPSDYSSSEFTTRKSEIVSLLAQAEDRMPMSRPMRLKMLRPR